MPVPFLRSVVLQRAVEKERATGMAVFQKRKRVNYCRNSTSAGHDRNCADFIQNCLVQSGSRRIYTETNVVYHLREGTRQLLDRCVVYTV